MPQVSNRRTIEWQLVSSDHSTIDIKPTLGTPHPPKELCLIATAIGWGYDGAFAAMVKNVLRDPCVRPVLRFSESVQANWSF